MLTPKREIQSVTFAVENGREIVSVRELVGVWDSDKGTWYATPTLDGRVLNSEQNGDAAAIGEIVQSSVVSAALAVTTANAQRDKAYADRETAIADKATSDREAAAANAERDEAKAELALMQKQYKEMSDTAVAEINRLSTVIDGLTRLIPAAETAEQG